MSYTIGQKGEITIEGWEKGIATSPHKGIGNIQAGNISTEPGEIMCNLKRTQQSLTNQTATGTLTAKSASVVTASVVTLKTGVWIRVSASTITDLTADDYYVLSYSAGDVTLTKTPYTGAAISIFGLSGTATFTILGNITKPIAKATESYNDGSNQQYRYYILDSDGYVWVYDTANNASLITWFLPDPAPISNATGLAVLNGWVMVFTSIKVWVKPTVWLSKAWVDVTNLSMLNIKAPHYAYVGHQNILYYTDGNVIGSIFPDNSLPTGATNTNTQSYCKYTAVTTTGTVTAIIGGYWPSSTGSYLGLPAVPAWFFSTGTKPTDLTVGTQYWIVAKPLLGTFEVYPTVADANAGTNKKDIATGAVGDQYFNTFWPISVTGIAAVTVTNKQLTLPFFETAQCLAELGNQIIIGCKGNVLYPWNQVDPKPGDLIPLPENDVVNMITVNNMVYVFAGNKGNIYVTNGSTASLILTLPDYCAGIAGTPQSYVEPYFTWGDAMYLRGRVWFSILDQIAAVSPFAAKAGNCGGIWSFVPTQNFFYGQDTGLALRLENQNSYGTYNGYATILLPAMNQVGRSPQYWSGWKSGLTDITYGIDGTGTSLSTVCVIDTDLIPTGTMLDKKTFSQIEYKLAAPLLAGESVTISYRITPTAAFTSCGTILAETSTDIAGYLPINFEKGQWLQLQITLNPGTAAVASGTSFVRLRQIIIR